MYLKTQCTFVNFPFSLCQLDALHVILFRVLLLGPISNCYACREGMHWRSGCKSYFLTLTCQEVLLLLLFLSLKLLHVHVCATLIIFFSNCILFTVFIVHVKYVSRIFNYTVILNLDFQERNGRPSEVGSSAKSSSIDSSPHSDGPACGSLAESNQINQALTRGSSLTGATGNGVLGEAILDHSDEHVSSALNHRKGNLVLEHDGRNGSVASYRGVVSEEDRDSNPGHARKDSAESIGSDLSSLRGSELSVPGASSSLWDGAVVDGHISQTEHLTGLDMHLLYDMDAQVILPNDQKQKLTRLLITMQRRIGTAKTDMEDLIARLNQEAAVKEYLTTKVLLCFSC